MPFPLLQDLCDRLVLNPSDTLILKRLACETGHYARCRDSMSIREFRVALAGAYRSISLLSSPDALYATGVLTGLLNALEVAEGQAGHQEESEAGL